MSRLLMAALFLACMLAGAIGFSLLRANDVAAANPGADGNGGNAVQGIATSACATDAGAGLCLDATGTLAGMASTQANAYTWSAAQTYNAIGNFAVLGAVGMAFTGDTNGALNLQANTPTGANAALKISSADATACGNSSTNVLLQFGAPGSTATTIACNDTVTFRSTVTSTAPITQTGNGNNLTYGSHIISNANCGSAASPQTNGSTCNGDMGYVVANATPSASITLGTAYTAGNATCQAWDNAAPTTLVGVTNTPTTTVAITSPTNAHVYFWHCWAFNGG